MQISRVYRRKIRNVIGFLQPIRSLEFRGLESSRLDIESHGMTGSSQLRYLTNKKAKEEERELGMHIRTRPGTRLGPPKLMGLPDSDHARMHGIWREARPL